MSKRTGRSAEPLLPVGRAEATDRELGRLWRYVDVLSRALRHLPSTSAAADGSPDDPCDPIAAADHVLIRGFVAHQPGAAEAVAARLTIIPRILGALCRRLGSPLTPHDLEDLAQDAMAIALRKLGQVGPRVPLDAWLHRLCNYELCNSLRRRYRHTSEELPPELASRDAAAIQQFEPR